MREELISLLEEAFEAGIITSTMQSQINTIKKNLKLNDQDYQLIEDEIRIDAYIKKVKEREKKGITFMGDLRKQYKITEDDKVVIQEKLKAIPKKAASSKTPEPVKKQESAPKQPAAPPNQSAPVSKSPGLPKQEKIEQSDVLKRSEILKQHEQMPAEMSEKKPEPVKKQESPKKVEQPKKESETRPLILVADDNEIQLFLTKSILEENNYDCVTADSPETAVRIISEKLPALVICDVNFGIGKPTGLDVYTNIRTKNIQVPFIVMSAFIQKEIKDHAKRIGITEYITKPADPILLLNVIRKYVPS